MTPFGLTYYTLTKKVERTRVFHSHGAALEMPCQISEAQTMRKLRLSVLHFLKVNVHIKSSYQTPKAHWMQRVHVNKKIIS